LPVLLKAGEVANTLEPWYLGFTKDGKLQYIGHTGSGFDEAALGKIYQKLEPLVTENCPFEKEPKTKMPVTWVKPKLSVK
jgi:bifunctional non-homologous end joining protein LigD